MRKEIGILLAWVVFLSGCDRGGDIRGRQKDGIRCNPKSEHRDYGGKWTGYHFDGWTSNRGLY